MSVFAGRMIEIVDISVDNFENDNLRSTAYFLSHAHTDHMRGLNDEAFHKRLTDAEEDGSMIYLYCSEITKVYLMNMSLRKLEKFIRVLPLGISVVEYPSTEKPHCIKSLAVTCISAGHCPGSVMFLFETDNCRILYTGDFRILPQDFIKFSSVSEGNLVKKIDTLYLDATFLDHSYSYFPSRAESAATVCTVINEWLECSDKHMVFLDLPAHCGTEYIFAKIKKTLGIQVHVKSEKYKQYEGIEEIRSCLTVSAHTRVHACCRRELIQGVHLPCRGNGYHTRVVKPSAMWFKSKGKDEKPLFRISDNGYRCKVAQSSHASYTELADIVHLLKPKKISPTALPHSKRRRDVMQLLKELNPNSVSEEYFQQACENNLSDDDCSSAEEFNFLVDSLEKDI